MKKVDYEQELKKFLEKEFVRIKKNIPSICIYRFLWEILNYTDSAGVVLFRNEGGVWHSHYPFFREDSEMSTYKTIINTVEFQSLLSKNYDLINKNDDATGQNIYAQSWFEFDSPHKINGKPVKYYRFIVIPVYMYTTSIDGELQAYLLAAIKPSRIPRESNQGIGAPYLLNKVAELSSLWFWPRNYNYQRRKEISPKIRNRRFSQEEIVAQRKLLKSSIFWPISFIDYLQIMDDGWDSLTCTAFETIPENHTGEPKNWSEVVRRRLCIRNKNCNEDDCKCNKMEFDEREIFHYIEPLIPYTRKYDNDWYKKYGETGFKALNNITGIFFDRISLCNLTNDELSLYFAFNFWNQYIGKAVHLKYWDMNILGPKEISNILKSSSWLAFGLLAGIPEEDNYINSIMWAVSRYGHDILNIEPRLDIGSHLLYAARGEPALHSLKPFYRDHFFHSIEVCFLGHMLLESKISDDKGYIWQYVQKYMGAKDEFEVLQNWYIAALFHDVGYAMEIFTGVQEALKFFKHSNELKNFTQSLESSLLALSKNMSGHFGFNEEDRPEKDHGVIGAEHLRGLINHIKITKEDMSDYDSACRAIANHNHRKNKIVFEKDPIAFLLILCDTVQEWNRPHLTYSLAATSILANMKSKTQNIQDSRSSSLIEHVGISLKKDSTFPGKFNFHDPKRLVFQLCYTDEINTNSRLFNLWIDSTCNLQRLCFTGLPFDDIELQFVNPLYTKSDNPQYQMHRLREAVSETHMNFLYEWFPNEPMNVEGASTNGAVTYYSDASRIPAPINSSANLNGKEAVVLNLKELTRTGRVSDSINTFRNKLAKWKRFNEDRDFLGDYDSEIPE